ncbi:expressed unknown protein [Seminavis robusta]|uniref:Uncharacterized protein n=1 Tax=Seminavis robusta TaxID=568900 RepID=A0A9N8DIY4_9STRA|nr:expressed unknown protein [Seminavis robusta]|eukprot:Sro113_g055930.1 n/a (524) ;mRNA; f:11920-13491
MTIKDLLFAVLLAFVLIKVSFLEHHAAHDSMVRKQAGVMLVDLAHVHQEEIQDLQYFSDIVNDELDTITDKMSHWEAQPLWMALSHTFPEWFHVPATYHNHGNKTRPGRKGNFQHAYDDVLSLFDMEPAPHPLETALELVSLKCHTLFTAASKQWHDTLASAQGPYNSAISIAQSWLSRTFFPHAPPSTKTSEIELEAVPIVPAEWEMDRAVYEGNHCGGFCYNLPDGAEIRTAYKVFGVRREIVFVGVGFTFVEWVPKATPPSSSWWDTANLADFCNGIPQVARSLSHEISAILTGFSNDVLQTAHSNSRFMADLIFMVALCTVFVVFFWMYWRITSIDQELPQLLPINEGRELIDDYFLYCIQLYGITWISLLGTTDCWARLAGPLSRLGMSRFGLSLTGLLKMWKKLSLQRHPDKRKGETTKQQHINSVKETVQGFYRELEVGDTESLRRVWRGTKTRWFRDLNQDAETSLDQLQELLNYDDFQNKQQSIRQARLNPTTPQECVTACLLRVFIIPSIPRY